MGALGTPIPGQDALTGGDWEGVAFPVLSESMRQHQRAREPEFSISDLS